MKALSLTENQKRIFLFIRVRFAALILISALVFYLKFIVQFNVPIWPNLLIIFLIAFYNIIYNYFVYTNKNFSESDWFTYLRSALDLLAITFLIHFTGGVGSPFILLYPLVLIAISIFGFTRAAYLLAGVAAIFYLINSLLEALFIISHYQLSVQAESLYLNFNYILAMAFALLSSGVMMVYATSYLTDKMRENQRKIEELSNARLDFIGQVVHETKSPLTSIIGYAELLSNQKICPVNETQKEPLLIIKRQSQRILAMVNDLLNLTRMELAKEKNTKSLASLTDLANRVIEECSPTLNSKKIRLIQEFDSKTPPLNLNEDKIQEVFTNLLSNATKFSNEGGKIFISITPAEKEVLVSVRDEGLGIDPIDLPHVFEKFYRSSKESVERKGTGLGLAVCKSIIEAHDGRIWAVSAGPGQGAVFYFALPL